jgi:hypothetical protein
MDCEAYSKATRVALSIERVARKLRNLQRTFFVSFDQLFQYSHLRHSLKAASHADIAPQTAQSFIPAHQFSTAALPTLYHLDHDLQTMDTSQSS